MSAFMIIVAASSIFCSAIIECQAADKYLPPDGEKEGSPEPFKFDYAVNDPTNGNVHSHQEESDGKVVKGMYSLIEADGTMREVTYTADENGFNAVVKKTGTPNPALANGSPKSSYGPPKAGGNGAAGGTGGY